VERLVSLFLLGEQTSSAHLVGEVEGERDYDAARALHVDALETGAPPARLAPGRLVAELGQVLGRSGSGNLLDTRGEFGAEVQDVVVLIAYAEPLVEREVAIGEAGERRLRAHDLQRVGIVDEQADRQVREESLEQEKVCAVGLPARHATGRSARAGRPLVRRMGRQGRSLLA
jgi:hypothetical protein